MSLCFLALPAFLIWLVILILPWRPWRIRESLDADPSYIHDLSDITVLIPARNEAEVIGETLNALLQQDKNLNVILINDQSADDTVSIAKHTRLENLKIIDGQPLPDGWSGKLYRQRIDH